MREHHFSQLAELYQRLQEKTRATSVNPCGDCSVCCTSSVLTSHKVTSLELDYIEHSIGSENIDRFRLFLKRDQTEPVCPYYSGGCTIYSVRPYSCRTFGHYRREDTRLPDVCVFQGQEHIFGVGEYRSAVPEAEDLASLSRSYWAFRQRRQDSGDTHYQAAGLGEATAKALECLTAGDREGALEHCQEEPAKDPFTLYCQSLIFEEIDQPRRALTALGEALRQAPESSDLWYRVGSLLMAAGQRQAAQQALQNTVVFDAGHGHAWGLLGLHHLVSGDIQDAVTCLERAAQLIPEEPIFRDRLAQARDSLEIEKAPGSGGQPEHRTRGV